jgi:succinate dehydrogenase / fumarate reductase cytochrome b subunit
MSPHLQIYKPQLTSVLSIANRLSAIAISAGTLMMVWWLVAASEGPKAYAAVQWFASSVLGVLILIGWALSLCYHTVGGLRHLAWDAGYGFDLPSVHLSGRLAVIATGVLFALIVIASLATWL